MIEITCIEKEEYAALVSKIKECHARLEAGDQIAREKLAVVVNLMGETTNAVGKLQDELQEMPGGYRNSQDIKHLKGRIERIEAKSPDVYDGRIAELAKRIAEIEMLKPKMRLHNLDQASGSHEDRLNDLEVDVAVSKGSPTLTDKRIKDLEEIARVMSKAVDDINNRMKEQREDYHTHIKDIRTQVEESNERRKKETEHAWNACNENTDLLNKARADIKTNGDKLNDHLIRTMNGTLDTPGIGKLAKDIGTLETCCKNVVAAGKETEKRVGFLELQGKNHSVRLDSHNSAIKRLGDFIERLKSL